MYVLHLESMHDYCCWGSWKAKVGHLLERRRNGAARSGGDKFAIVREVKHIYPIELKVRTPRLPAWMDNGG